jgi:hypothetical protein
MAQNKRIFKVPDNVKHKVNKNWWLVESQVFYPQKFSSDKELLHVYGLTEKSV